MKTLSITIILSALTAAGSLLLADESKKPAAKAAGEKKKMQTLELHVSGMSCHNCSDAVEDALAALDGLEVE